MIRKTFGRGVRYSLGDRIVETVDRKGLKITLRDIETGEVLVFGYNKFIKLCKRV